MFDLVQVIGGFPHPDHLLRHLNARQLNDWSTYHRLWGFGPLRDDIREANASWHLKELFRMTGLLEDDRPVKDFMVSYDHDIATEPQNEGTAAFNDLMAILNEPDTDGT